MSSKRPTTPAQSQAMMERAVRRWTDRIDARIDRKLDDAAAHAEKAATDALRSTPDGRPSARKAASSPSLRAAKSRIEELRVELVGPRADSLSGLMRDARAEFYRSAFAWAAPYLVPEVHRLDAEPTKAGEAVARGAVIHGYDLASEVQGVFDAAQRTLSAVVLLASSESLEPGRAGPLLAAWKLKQRRTISSRAALCLGDSAHALLWAVEQAVASL